MRLDKQILSQIVIKANLAPSVHNTQPTRWRIDDSGIITLMLDRERLLSIGDPLGRDARLSLGAALEGTKLALSEAGFGIKQIEKASGSAEGPLQPLFHIECCPLKGDVLLGSRLVDDRFTWRGGFAPASAGEKRGLVDAAQKMDGLTIIDGVADIALLADMNDAASLTFFKDKAYREELVSWMRFSAKDSRWAQDGLSASALDMSRIEAMGANVALRSPIFDILNGLGVAKMLLSENTKTCSASAIALFHRPRDEDPAQSGIAYYQYLLAFTDAGFSTWPMAILADAEETRLDISKRFGVPDGHRLINVLRVGIAPPNAHKNRARLSTSTLVV